MAKRFTDSEKWQKPWFRKLPPNMKLVWIYLLDACDIAGVWVVDMEVVEFFVKERIDESEVLECLGERIEVFDSGRKWFVRDFVEFQYGAKLNPSNRLHHSVITRLEKYGLSNTNEGPSKGLASPLEGAKDKDKDKVKVKDKDIILLEGGEGGNHPKRERFSPPPRDDVANYAATLGLADAEVDKFIDHYTANGWKVGRNSMKDWRSALRNWQRNAGQYTSGKTQAKTNERIPFTKEAIEDHDRKTKDAYEAYDAARNPAIPRPVEPQPHGLQEH